MSQPAQKPRLTADEYLTMERASAEKHEFFDGEIFAMAGGSPEHNLIATNVIYALVGALRGRCLAFSSDQQIFVPATGLFTYPDASVVCGQAEFGGKTSDLLLNPVMLVEVLSASTENYDRGRKFANYRTISSLQRYVLVAQDQVLVEHYTRQPAGWLFQTCGAGQHLPLPCEGVDPIAVDDFYLGLPLR